MRAQIGGPVVEMLFSGFVQNHVYCLNMYIIIELRPSQRGESYINIIIKALEPQFVCTDYVSMMRLI